MVRPVHTAYVIADDSEEEDDLRADSAGLYPMALAHGETKQRLYVFV